ncbi:DNA ligase [Marinomonas sp. M1K-6]|uniref:DNA ligase n=1 Tax=Marinomonas profundi TaxID=2726122 RepID=A0A847QZB0_9GAMM|nr:DNA ligase [Marinomonas profundi]NLQ16165.1 DNA ligase [Marinomonas profundi]UDV03251.1 DNA ligase [Marinomonas profundi]
MFLKQCLVVCFLLFPAFALPQPDQPAVQLATLFSDDVQVNEYLISEKYDGIRAIWTGNELVTRQGNPIYAPDWFTDPLPPIWLDGELWSQHNDFAFIMSAVRKHDPVESEWRKIHYMVFDAPDQAKEMPFEKRYQRYSRIVNGLNVSHILPVAQFSVADNQALSSQLEMYVKNGAEGLMLHRKLATFESGRTDSLLKLKPYMDAEAKVIAILNGAGKYDGMMGSILVEMPSGIRFKIGSGFSDQERLHPPQVGDQVTYKYHGFTQRGIPRFASFLRLRNGDY